MSIPKNVVSTEEKRFDHFALININAEEVTRNDDGTWHVVIKAKTLTEEEHKFLNHMFPHLTEAAYDLLNKEILLSAIVK